MTKISDEYLAAYRVAYRAATAGRPFNKKAIDTLLIKAGWPAWYQPSVQFGNRSPASVHARSRLSKKAARTRAANAASVQPAKRKTSRVKNSVAGPAPAEEFVKRPGRVTKAALLEENVKLREQLAAALKTG